jgi:hypothetical protein
MAVDSEMLVPADGASEAAERPQAVEGQGRDTASIYDQLSPGLFLAQEQSVRLQARLRGDGDDVLIVLLLQQGLRAGERESNCFCCGQKRRSSEPLARWAGWKMITQVRIMAAMRTVKHSGRKRIKARHSEATVKNRTWILKTWCDSMVRPHVSGARAFLPDACQNHQLPVFDLRSNLLSLDNCGHHAMCTMRCATGPLPAIHRRRPTQSGNADANKEEEEGGQVDPKRKYNVVMALILMLMFLGLLAAIFAQVRQKK